MLKIGRRRQRTAAFLALVWLLAMPALSRAAELKKKTLEAFEQYVRLTEARIDEELRDGSRFLWVDMLPEARRQTVYAQLQQGQVAINRLETSEKEKPIKVPDGLIHHWVGIIFIPDKTLRQTLALVQDYDNHQDIYKPDVARSKLLHRDGNDFKVYLRFFKKKVFTVVLNTEHDAHYVPVDATRVHGRSYTTRIAEVENHDRADEREKPVGKDRGFLWRLYSYWRFQEKDGGVYVQCEAISLTRNLPTGLDWLLGSFITGVPKESLFNTLSSTRAALITKPTTAAAH